MASTWTAADMHALGTRHAELEAKGDLRIGYPDDSGSQARTGSLDKHPIVRILETAPGFAPIRSARLVPVVVTPHRFRTKRQFWSYCGLGIVMRSSSDWVRTADGGWVASSRRALAARSSGVTCAR